MPQLLKPCAKSIGTVDGSEIRQTHQLRLVVYLIIYKVLAPFQMVGNGISEPSNSITPLVFTLPQKRTALQHFSNKTSGCRLCAVGDDTSFIGIVFLATTPRKIDMEHNNGGLVKIMFLSKWVICRFHVNLPGCRLTTIPLLTWNVIFGFWSLLNWKYLEDFWSKSISPNGCLG